MRVVIENFGFDNTTKYLMSLYNKKPLSTMNKIGSNGVSALKSVTPVRTGRLASGWNYNVEKTDKGYDLYWYNNAYPAIHPSLVALLEYGHGTGTGGYVPGRHFVKQASKSILSQASDSIGKEMSK